LIGLLVKKQWGKRLPRLALRSKNIDEFFVELDKLMELACRQLLHRFNVIASLKVKDLPFLMGQKLYMGSENLKDDDEIREAIKNGTLAIGFIGLAEALISLTGKHHGESEEAWNLGYKISRKLSRLQKDSPSSLTLIL
jgi:ribonucleoside-triphosphate reductase